MMKRLAVVSVVYLVAPVLISSAGAQPADYWKGFYAGLNVGYGWSGQAIEVSGDPETQFAIGAGILPGTLANNPSGVIGGGQAGYNYRIGWLLLGAEADFQGADISAAQTVSTVVPPLPGGLIPFPFTTTAEQDLDFLGTLRGRIGVVPWGGPLLLYGTGGFAYGHVRLSASVMSETQLITSPPITCLGLCVSGSRSGVEAGWTVGGGVEYGFAQRWSVKAEYLHYDLGSFSLNIRDTRFPGTVQTFSTDFKGNVVRVGVNFRF